MRRFLFAFLLVAFTTGSLSAQRRPRVYRTNDPGVWMTAGISGFRANGVNDGATSSTWNFGNATNFQYRASLEKGVANGASFGIAGSYAHVPFAYSSNLANPLPSGVSGNRCAAGEPSCDAHLDLMTLVATFHSGSGYGLHQVLELDGGIVAYQNLQRDSDGAKLAPGGGNIDPLFSLGWGFGYGFSDRTNLDFISTYTFGIHERKGLSNGVSNTNSMPSLRISLRRGFGGRTVRR
jgi:hypothetical protein